MWNNTCRCRNILAMILLQRFISCPCAVHLYEHVRCYNNLRIIAACAVWHEVQVKLSHEPSHPKYVFRLSYLYNGKTLVQCKTLNFYESHHSYLSYPCFPSQTLSKRMERYFYGYPFIFSFLLRDLLFFISEYFLWWTIPSN